MLLLGLGIINFSPVNHEISIFFIGQTDDRQMTDGQNRLLNPASHKHARGKMMMIWWWTDITRWYTTPPWNYGVVPSSANSRYRCHEKQFYEDTGTRSKLLRWAGMSCCSPCTVIAAFLTWQSINTDDKYLAAKLWPLSHSPSKYSTKHHCLNKRERPWDQG